MSGGFGIGADRLQAAEVVEQAAARGLQVEDGIGREGVLHAHVGRDAQFVREAEGRVDVHAGADVPTAVLVLIVGCEAQGGVVVEVVLAVNSIVHLQGQADGLPFGDDAPDIGLGAGQNFLRVIIVRTVLPLIEHQVGFGTVLHGQVGSGGGHAHVHVARSEFLLTGVAVRQEVEVAQSEMPGHVQVQAAETVGVVHGGAGAVVEGVPLRCVVAPVQLAVHAIHAEHQAEAVGRRETEEVVGIDVQVVIVAIARPDVARCGLLGHLVGGKGLHGVCRDLRSGGQGNVVFHLPGRHLRLVHAGQDVDLGGVAQVGGIFLFHHHGAVQGGVGILSLSRQSCGQQQKGGEGVLYFCLHFTIRNR